MSDKKKEKLQRAFDVQCFQYWQASLMVRQGLNPATLEPLNQPPAKTLEFLNRWLELLAWSPKLHKRMLDLKAILEKDVQDYEEQKLQANS